MEEVRQLNVLVDVNVLLDVFLAREPWMADAQAVWAAHHRLAIIGHVAAHGITNLFFIARRLRGADEARRAVRLCLHTFEIIPVGRPELELADAMAGNDLEDNLQIACAIEAKLDAIVTRDAQGFSLSPIPILTPAELLTRIANTRQP